MFLTTSGTPFWTPKDCENITAAAATSGGMTAWSDKEKEVLTVLGEGQGQNKSSSVGVGVGVRSSGTWPLSPMSLRTLADKSETLSSFGFLKTPTTTTPSRSSLVDWYSGLAPMGQSVHAIEVRSHGLTCSPTPFTHHLSSPLL